MFDGAGNQLSRRTPVWKLPDTAATVCERCGYSIQLFRASNPQSIRQQIEVVETERSEEFVGWEERSIDNRCGVASVIRKFSVAHEWSRECKIEDETTKRASGGLGAFGRSFGRLSFEIEQIIKKRYSSTASAKEIHREEIELSVPPGSSLKIRINWKKIWQHGYVRVLADKSVIETYRYAIAVGMTFDQIQQRV